MTPLRNNWHIIAIAAITLLGLCLRLYNLTWQCLAVDEVVTQEIGAHTSAYIIHWALTIDCNPPTYYLLAHWSSVILGGVSWFSIRIPAVILGTLAIPMSYFVGKQVHGKTLGLLVATLISFMFPFVFYAQNARGYSLVLCAFLGFVYFWLMLIDGDRNIKTGIVCSAFAALCLYSHYYSVIPIATALFILLYKNRNQELISMVIISLAVFVLPLGLTSNASNLLARAAPDAIPGYAMLTPDHQWWISPLQMATFLPNELLCWSWIVLLPLCGYACYRYREVRPPVLIAMVSCIALVGIAAISNLSPRYALLVSPLLIIAATYPIAELIDRQQTMSRKASLFLLVIFAIAVFNYGSLLSWFTFNVCPLVNGINAGIQIIS